MEIKRNAVAGTTESSDIMITLDPSETNDISIALISNVEKQFGRRITEVITNTLQQAGITSAKVTAIDKGALDCTITARTITAVHRALDNSTYNWKEMDSWNV